MNARRFLLLQGVCSPFFMRLADRLQAEGHGVFKVNFNAGDRAYWGLRPAAAFRRELAALPEFIDALFTRHGITDQIVFGDWRPVHEPALRLARGRGIRNHVFEEGYFRPHWVTLEREGANAHSRLPRDAAWFRRAGAGLPDPTPGAAFAAPFWKRAAHDVAYHLAGLGNPLFFPRYRTHAPVRADREYLAYLRRFARVRARREADRARVAALAQGKAPFFLLPLQLDADAQIRLHSGYRDMRGVIDHVLESFARAAPPQARLVVKNHPLDNGVRDYARVVAAAAARRGLAGRVDYLESGDLDSLLRHARGTVTVNSTVGVTALAARCPTLALGDPIYRIAGLAADQPLDAFWRAPEGPDPELFRCFRNAVIHLTQVRGGFYSREGIELAVENSVRPLTADHPLLESLPCKPS